MVAAFRFSSSGLTSWNLEAIKKPRLVVIVLPPLMVFVLLALLFLESVIQNDVSQRDKAPVKWK
jgi:hypothetical protein